MVPQKKRLHHIMNRKKGGSKMIPKYIHVDKEAENSYSFAVGDEIRKALVAPWKLPILPLSLPKRIFAHRKTISHIRLGEAIADCLFIFDLEKMRISDQKSFTNQALNYANNCIGIGIGEPSFPADYKHTLPTRRQLNIEPREWNSMLKYFLLGVIRSYKPKKVVFVGKYPYAGIMSVLRKCKPKNGFYWIHVRGDAEVLEERSTKFNLTKALAFFTDQDSIVRNTIFFDYEPPKELVEKLSKKGVHIIQTKEHAEYMSLVKPNYDFKGMLMKNQTLFLQSEIEKYLGFIPNYLLPNLVVTEPENTSNLIEDVVTFRKRLVGKKSPVMSVEVKLDLWLS